jgi:DNA-binding FrmR family transcriptional regulator
MRMTIKSHTAPGYHDDKAAVLARLKRIEGQIRGLQRMVADDTYCIDVLTQVSAATKALQSVAVQLLDDHLRTACPNAGAVQTTAPNQTGSSPRRAAPSNGWCAHDRRPARTGLQRPRHELRPLRSSGHPRGGGGRRRGGIDVDLDSKLVTVRGEALDRDRIVAAIDEAGYDRRLSAIAASPPVDALDPRCLRYDVRDVRGAHRAQAQQARRRHPPRSTTRPRKPVSTSARQVSRSTT